MKELEQKITFERKEDGSLVRKIHSKAPVKLDSNVIIGDDESNSVQVLTKDGEQKYRAFLEKEIKAVEEFIKKQDEELKNLKNLGNENLAKEDIERLAKLMEDVKKNPELTKKGITNLDKLCNILVRRLSAKANKEFQGKRLVHLMDEWAELGKVQ